MAKFVRLGDVATSSYGLTASATSENTGSRFLRITDIVNGKPGSYDSTPFVETGDVDISKFELKRGDIVIARTGATVGTTHWFSGWTEPVLFASYLVRFAPKADVVSSRFLSYVLRSRSWNEHVYATAYAKSAQPNMSARAMAEYQFSLPSLSQQRQISELLGSLDDKIAANQTAVSTGTELLMSLYRRIQKHAAEPFGQVCDVFGGSTPSTKIDEYWGGSINWATPTDLTALQGPWLTDTERKITEAGLQSMSSALHPSGSILMTSRATIGRVAVAATPVTTNQGFIVIRASEELTPWVFCQLQDRVREFEAWSNGATFLEISRGNFKKLPFYRAEPQDLAEFNAKAKPLLEMCKAKQEENFTLTKTRDELLPLLMNGKITVREASQEAAAVGAAISSEENEV